MALTRILNDASSIAMALVAVIIAPLEVLYQASPGRGRRPAVEATFKITPCPCSFISGTPCLAVKNTDFTFTAKIRSNSSSVTSVIGLFR